MVSLIEGGKEEREVTSKDCRLTVLSKKCVKREGSLKWVLMHKLQGLLEPQSCKRQWKEQNPTQKKLGFNCLCITETTWYFLRDEKGMGTLMSRGRRMLRRENTVLVVAPCTEYFFHNYRLSTSSSSHRKKIRPLSDFVDLNSEVFLLWFSNCKNRQTM